MNFASGNFAEFDDSFLLFAIAFYEVIFVETDGGYFWKGVNCADETLVIDGAFDLVNNVVGESSAFGLSAVGGGFSADAVAEGVDVFGRSFKEAIDRDAGFLVFDFGVFETEV